jgi:hypothetical protein
MEIGVKLIYSNNGNVKTTGISIPIETIPAVADVIQSVGCFAISNFSKSSCLENASYLLIGLGAIYLRTKLCPKFDEEAWINSIYKKEAEIAAIAKRNHVIYEREKDKYRDGLEAVIKYCDEIGSKVSFLVILPELRSLEEDKKNNLKLLIESALKNLSAYELDEFAFAKKCLCEMKFRLERNRDDLFNSAFHQLKGFIEAAYEVEYD